MSKDDVGAGLPDPTPAEVDALLALPHIGRAVLDVAAMARRDGHQVEARGLALVCAGHPDGGPCAGPATIVPKGSTRDEIITYLAKRPWQRFDAINELASWARAYIRRTTGTSPWREQ